MEITPQFWELLKMLLVAYTVYLLNKHDRNQNELFKRITAVEINCARNSGSPHTHGRKDDDV